MEPLNQLLAERGRRFASRHLRAALGVSAAAHVLLVAGLILVPGLLRSEPPRIEYVEVVSVPAAQLQPGPRPEPEQQAPPPEPEPEPEPVVEEPEPVPEDIPLLEPEEEDPEPVPEPAQPVEEPPPVQEPPEEDADPGPARPDLPDLPAASQGEVEDTSLAGFDDPDFQYDYYSQSLVRAIDRTWRRPRIQRKMDLAIQFRIARDGTVSDIQVVRPSGIPSYDRAGVRALEEASPLPPLPASYRKPSLGVTVLLP